ncbi:MAG: chromate resistance protein ChrB domain-containing protein [Pseudomonadota bacterium]
MPSPNTITPAQLARLIGTPDCPMIFDVRTVEDFNADPCLLPTALRFPFEEFDESQIMAVANGQPVVVYCWRGLKISQGIAALLRTLGLQAEVLEGGHVGWREASLPLLAADKFVGPGATEGGLWVTRHRPKIDRIACPWFIRRSIDRHARFLFVEPGQVLNVAERFNATAFDVKGAPFTHEGDQCSFDALLKASGIIMPALDIMATIIRAADTGQHAAAAEAAGLHAFSMGLSRMFRDDVQQLEVGLLIYDALFRWARDAREERHDWPGQHLAKADGLGVGAGF